MEAWDDDKAANRDLDVYHCSHRVLSDSCYGSEHRPPPAPKNQDEGLDHLLQRTAAARLLAAMETDPPIDMKVARLVDRLVIRDRDQVQAAVTALVMLGPPAVPALIIQRIDDRRNMKVHTATFENRFPDAFEAVAQLGVEQVIDCLNLVLSDITAESFGFVDVDFQPDSPSTRHRNDENRKLMIVGWNGYLRRLRGIPHAPGKSLPGR